MNTSIKAAIVCVITLYLFLTEKEFEILWAILFLVNTVSFGLTLYILREEKRYKSGE